MDKLSILVQLEAKPGKEHEVEQFLKSALPLVQAETGTTTWYALKMGPSKFGIFDTFADEKGRNAHLWWRSRESPLRKGRGPVRETARDRPAGNTGCKSTASLGEVI